MAISEKRFDKVYFHVEVMNKEFGMMVKRMDILESKVDTIDKKMDQQNVELAVLKSNLKYIIAILGVIGTALLYQIVKTYFVAH